jgi:hypothetical protein
VTCFSLKTDEGLDHYLAGAFAIGADRAGLIPSEDQVYGWRIAPAIGGQFELANIEIIE